MKHILRAAVAACMLTAGSAQAAIQSSVYSITGWSCEGCGKKTVTVVKRVPGVKSAVADVASGTLRVTFDDAAFNPAAAREAVERLGYVMH